MAESKPKPDEKKSDPKTPHRPVKRYRFKVTSPDGQELTSAIASIEQPVPLAGAQWSAASAGAGEKVAMRVGAPGRDGETITFVVERKKGEGWETIATSTGTVKDGKVEVQQAMPSLPVPEGHGVKYTLAYQPPQPAHPTPPTPAPAKKS